MRKKVRQPPTSADFLRETSTAKIGLATLVFVVGALSRTILDLDVARGIMLGGVLFAVASVIGWALQVAVDRWFVSGGGIQVGAYVVKLLVLIAGTAILHAVAPGALRSALLTFAGLVVAGLAIDAIVGLRRPVEPVESQDETIAEG